MYVFGPCSKKVFIQNIIFYKKDDVLEVAEEFTRANFAWP